MYQENSNNNKKIYCVLFSYVLFIILTWIPFQLYSQPAISLNYISSFGKFENAQSISIDQEKNIYVVDRAINKIMKYSPEHELLSSIGSYGWGDLNFDYPYDIIAGYGFNFFITDYGNHRIQRFDKNFNYLTSYSSINNDPLKKFGYPMGITISIKGEIFFVDSENIRIVKINSSGEFEKPIGDMNSGMGRLHQPTRLRIDEANLLYALDKNCIKVYDLFGNFIKNLYISTDVKFKSFFIKENLLYLLKEQQIDVISENGNLIYSLILKDKIPEDRIYNDIILDNDDLYLLSCNCIYLFKILKN